MHACPIAVTVSTQFLQAQSEPSKGRFAFSYTITIRNYGQQAAKLMSRHWIITDANGGVQEVHGEGVVGEQPLILPGKSYCYSSGAILSTPVGSMHGTYTLKTENGDFFDAPIPAFSLAMPMLVN